MIDYRKTLEKEMGMKQEDKHVAFVRFTPARKLEWEANNHQLELSFDTDDTIVPEVGAKLTVYIPRGAPDSVRYVSRGLARVTKVHRNVTGIFEITVSYQGNSVSDPPQHTAADHLFIQYRQYAIGFLDIVQKLIAPG
jgi:hypothetical protein